jgi:hypothetical protein
MLAVFGVLSNAVGLGTKLRPSPVGLPQKVIGWEGIFDPLCPSQFHLDVGSGLLKGRGPLSFPIVAPGCGPCSGLQWNLVVRGISFPALAYLAAYQDRIAFSLEVLKSI